ncbi:pseudouridine synthase [Salinibius halmophilus]|uniref:pseudouridine synthase n=1 Tax=Salinibius halmophilus TaxID=1853216 RepID=UPI000E66F1AD|nr:pseudouridine synthase [Salinibius halmophilus]
MKKHPDAPLPFKDGIAPSYVNIPYGPWPNILRFLVEKFPRMDPEVIRHRIEIGDLVYQDGSRVCCDDKVVADSRIWYYREVPNEPEVPFKEQVLFEDERIIIVDKPHMLSSIPAGRFLKQSLLSRLRATFDNQLIAPAHRLDRETAGVMLFTKDPAYRGAYQMMFQARKVEKSYLAVAANNDALQYPYVHKSCMVKGDKFFTMHEVDGPANSETQVMKLKTQGELALYRLNPHTGKQHQLRVHMASLGMPILNDPWYPVVKPERAHDDFSNPLQLLAQTLSFVDPVDGQTRYFASQQQLTITE